MLRFALYSHNGSATEADANNVTMLCQIVDEDAVSRALVVRPSVVVLCFSVALSALLVFT